MVVIIVVYSYYFVKIFNSFILNVVKIMVMLLSKMISFLKNYMQREEVELILIGMPKNWDDSDTHATSLVHNAIQKLKKEFPAIPIKEVDERYTSKLASQAMIEMGMKKKQRQVKGNVDQIAAAIMLQEYLNART